MFLLTTFVFLSQRRNISSRGKDIISFLVFKLVFTRVFCFYFPLFFQMSAVIVREWKFYCTWFRSVLRNKYLTHFRIFNFLGLRWAFCRAAKNNNISGFLISLNIKLSSFVDVFYYILALQLFNFQ